MSKVKIEGNASGTGTLTISAPNTNTDRSLTLPDTAGEVLVTDGTITIDDTNDRVGIGTSSPRSSLEVEKFGASASDNFEIASLTAEYSGNTTNESFGGYLSFRHRTGGNQLVESSRIGVIGKGSNTGYLVFYTGGGAGVYPTERMRINNSGNVGIGTSSPDYTLEVGDVATKGWSVNIENNVAKMRSSSNLTDTQTHWEIRNGNGAVGSVKTVNSSTQFNTSSDYRLKENVVDMTGAIDRLKLLQPRIFNFIADPDIEVDGFIAHEVSDIVPIAVSGEKDATKEEEYEVTPAVLDDDGNVVTEAVMGTRTVPDYQGIDQSKLVPLLTGALQEAIAKIETLETRIEALENA